MQFCPKCGSLMMPATVKGKKISKCSCGYKSAGSETTVKESIKKSETAVDVVEQKETLPLIDEECPKCAHKKAYYWTMQTRAADEGETKFLKCEACKHTWRDYG